MSTCQISMKTLLRVFIFLCIVGCARAEELYFPIQTKPGEPGVSAFEAKWYSESLRRMNEPRLTEAAKDPRAVIFRLLILPTWGNPIAVRAEKHGMIYTLAARRLDGMGGYDPGKLVEQKSVQLSGNDSAALEMLIAQLKFFQMPTDGGDEGVDGEEWIIEGVSSGCYHHVERWSASSYNPKKRGLTAFIGLCRFLIDKSALSERPTNKGEKLI